MRRPIEPTSNCHTGFFVSPWITSTIVARYNRRDFSLTLWSRANQYFRSSFPLLTLPIQKLPPCLVQTICSLRHTPVSLLTCSHKVERPLKVCPKTANNSKLTSESTDNSTANMPPATIIKPTGAGPPVSAPKLGSRSYQVSPSLKRAMQTSSQTVTLNGRRSVPTEVLDCVVKVFTTFCRPDFSLPWAMSNQETSVASGFLIENRRIITNAHVVEYHTSILVKRRGSDEKFAAELLAVSHEADLALLTIRDNSFWEGEGSNQDKNSRTADNSESEETEETERIGNGTENGVPETGGIENGENERGNFPYFPLDSQSLPNLQDAVTVIGYPFGGENISVTAGVVSRIEIQQYEHGKTCLLAIQIDAAINSGASGGPVLNEKCELIGVAHQGYAAAAAELIGYFIPRSVFDQFLADYERNGRCTGISTCGFRWQNVGNESLRRYMRVPDPQRARGILVKSVEKTSGAYTVLRKGDIVTKIDGIEISDQGSVPFMKGERVGFDYHITRKHVGETVCLSIIRDGKAMEVDYRLSSIADSRLVRTHELRKQPEYLIVGGLTFVALTLPFVTDVFGDMEYTSTRIREKILFGEKESHNQEIVVLSSVLNAKVNFGYQELGVVILRSFNGKKVINLETLAEMVEACTDEFLRFELDDNETIILDREEAHSANEKLLKQYRIPSASSIGPLED